MRQSFARRIAWALATPVRKAMFFRTFGAVQDFAIDFFELTNIRSTVAKATERQKAEDDRDAADKIAALEKRHQRAMNLEVSRLEGVNDTLRKKVEKLKRREDEADYKLYVAKILVKECTKNATMLVAEAHELGAACLKVSTKGRRLKGLFGDMARRLNDVSEGKRVRIETHEG